MKKKKKYLFIIAIVLFIFALYEIKGNFRIGGIIRDFLNAPFKEDSNDLITVLNKEIEKENKELKDLLNISYSDTDYEMINASVIERNSTYWLDELTINKGKSDGVENNQFVITEKGLIGKVIDVANNTSKIRLITGFSEPIMVSVNNNSKMLFADNYNLYIKGINKEDGIVENDKIVTLGLSNNYPKGLLIGEIESISKSTDGVGFFAKVRLADNLKNIKFVSVLRRKNK